MKIDIAILSYNRPIQLKRVLDSCKSFSKEIFNIKIYDDCSPQYEQIQLMFDTYFSTEENFKLIRSEQNVGYDLNLLRAVTKSSSDFVLLISDDDYLELLDEGHLMTELSHLQADVAFLPVRFDENLILRESIKRNVLYRTVKNQGISLREFNNRGYHLYHFILFSGLIIKPAAVRLQLEVLSTYLNSIYIQIAIAIACLDKGAMQIFGVNVVLGSDGENGFGFNAASSKEDRELRDRNNVHADLKYQKRLYSVVKRASRDFNKPGILSSFKREYCIRAIYRMLKLREKLSRKDFKDMRTYYPSLWLIGLAHIVIAYLPLRLVKLLFNIKRPLEVIRGTAQGH